MPRKCLKIKEYRRKNGVIVSHHERCYIHREPTEQEVARKNKILEALAPPKEDVNSIIGKLMSSIEPVTEQVTSKTVDFTAKGGNKAVDEKGEPITLYRAGEIDTPIKNDKYTVGRFFTTVERAAEAFGKDVKKAIVVMKNPFIVDAKEEGYSSIEVPKEMRDDVYEGMDTIDTDNIAEWAYKNGYDGAIIKNVYEGGSVAMKRDAFGYGVTPPLADNYIVFDAKQIKAVEQSLKETPKAGSGGVGGDVKLETLNPTGGVFVKYSAEQRDKMPLGKNITTYDKTSGVRPDKKITIYRGVPKNINEIQSGDYITTNKQLAQDYAGNGHVVSKEVRADEILDDKTESLGEEYILREKSLPANAIEIKTDNGWQPLVDLQSEPEGVYTEAKEAVKDNLAFSYNAKVREYDNLMTAFYDNPRADIRDRINVISKEIDDMRAGLPKDATFKKSEHGKDFIESEELSGKKKIVSEVVAKSAYEITDHVVQTFFKKKGLKINNEITFDKKLLDIEKEDYGEGYNNVEFFYDGFSVGSALTKMDDGALQKHGEKLAKEHLQKMDTSGTNTYNFPNGMKASFTTKHIGVADLRDVEGMNLKDVKLIADMANDTGLQLEYWHKKKNSANTTKSPEERGVFDLFDVGFTYGIGKNFDYDFDHSDMVKFEFHPSMTTADTAISKEMLPDSKEKVQLPLNKEDFSEDDWKRIEEINDIIEESKRSMSEKSMEVVRDVQDQFESLTEKISKEWDTLSKEEQDALMDQRRELSTALSLITAEALELGRNFYDKRRSEILKLLLRDKDFETFEWHKGEEFDEAKTFITRFLNEVPKEVPKIVMSTDRAYYQPAEETIYLRQLTDLIKAVPSSRKDYITTIIHEYGHHAEHKKAGGWALSEDFLLEQGKPELEFMQKYSGGYSSDEVVIRDDFYHTYVGKVYKPSWNAKTINATEVVSMGLQYLYSNPFDFMRKSPQHAAFMLKNYWAKK